MADELVDVNTEGDLLEDNAGSSDEGETTETASEDEAIENSSDVVEEEAAKSSAELPDEEETMDPLELASLEMESLDAELEELEAESDESNDADNVELEEDDDDEEDEPPSQKSISVELTDAELAALDAEIAAQLDAEAEQGGSGDEWYFVHTYSGMENKVKKNLEHRIESMGMADLILQIVVPTETEVEIRKGVRKEVEKRVFPGYILVNMVVDEDSWYVVRNTPGVTGFVGMGNKPTPLSPDEISRIMERLDADEPVVKVSFQLGEQVRITGGPFAEFNGIVEEIHPDKGKAKVMVSFFNRETPVEVDFVQLEREE